MHCQTQTLDYIVKEGGDCILQVKGNQPQLSAAVQAQFADYIDKNADAAGYTEEDKGHGRQEKRLTFQIPLYLPIELTEKWPQLRTLVAVERHRTMGKKTSIDTHFYVSSTTSLKLKIKRHWLRISSLFSKNIPRQAQSQPIQLE